MTAPLSPTPPSAQAVPARPDGYARIVHTSDWHLGATLRGHPRAADHDVALADVGRIAAEAAPDVIVHTGDLFDSARPPMADFKRAITALRDLAAIAPVLVIAGNHDSPGTLDALACAVEDPLPDLLAGGGTCDPHQPINADNRIRILPRPCPPDRGGVTTYPTVVGRRLRIAALPFVHANRVLTDFDDYATAGASYADNLRKLTNLLATSVFDPSDWDPASDVAIFASHLHVTNAALTSEKKVHTSETYAADMAQIHDGFAYIALGHIHLPQTAGGNRARYPGSLIEVDFGELGQQKQTLVVDCHPSRPKTVTAVEHDQGRRLHRFRFPFDELQPRAAGIGDGLVEVTVTPPADDSDPDLLVVNGHHHDSLGAAVAAALPEATVVDVRDARRTHVAVDDDPITSSGEDQEPLVVVYQNWLAANTDLVTRYGHGQTTVDAVATIFGSLHDIGDDTDLSEPETLTRLASRLPAQARAN